MHFRHKARTMYLHVLRSREEMASAFIVEKQRRRDFSNTG